MKKNYGWAAYCGRILLGLFFFVVGVLSFTDTSINLSALVVRNIPYPDLILNVLMALEVILGLLLVFGVCERIVAWLLILLTLATTVLFCNFWDMTGPAKMTALMQFLSDIAIIAGLLWVADKKCCDTTQCS